jgi:hypothetical protein
MSPTATRRVPDIVLERYRLSELPAAEAERLERQLLEDETLRRRLGEIEASDGELLRGSFPERLAAGVRRDVRATGPLGVTAGRRSSTSTWRWLIPALAAAGAVVLVAIITLPAIRGGTGRPPSSPTAPVPDERIKGLEPSLTLFRKGPGGSEVLADNTVAHAGDLIRVAYQAAGRAYGVIVSVDGRGGVTLHLPSSGFAAASLQAGDRVLLEQAYELDDAPRWEKFYLVTGNEPFEVAPIVSAARRAAESAGSDGPPALDLPPGLEQASLSIAKKGRS